MPTMAQRSRWEKSSGIGRNLRRNERAEDFSGVLAKLGSTVQVGRAEAGEAERHAWIQGRRDVIVLDLDEEVPRLQVDVVEKVIGRVDRPYRQPSGLTVLVGLVRRLQQEEDLDDLLDVVK